MRILRYTATAIITCMLATSGIQAQSDVLQDIVVYLDSTAGVYCSNLNYNEFFSESYVVARIHAGTSGNAEDIKITEYETTLSGNSDKYSIKTAEKLLLESCRNIINSNIWKEGENRCRIVWKSRYLHGGKNPKTKNRLKELIDECITNESKKKIYGVDGSAYIYAKADNNGIIQETRYIGNIYWGTDEIALQSEKSSDLKINYYSNGGKNLSLVPGRYQFRKEQNKFHKRNSLFKESAELIGDRLIGKKLCDFINCPAGEAEACIEIHIDTRDIEIDHSAPVFPGGIKELKKVLLAEICSNKVIERNNVAGSVVIEFFVKKSGKAKVYDVRPNITKESHSGWDSENKVVKAICDEVTDAIKKMPRWTPEMYDGKPRETYCVVRLKLKGEEE